jgi:hypothetical protein
VSEIISTKNLPPEDIYNIGCRVGDIAKDYIKADPSQRQRLALSPLLSVLFHGGPNGFQDYLRPNKTQAEKKPDWSAVEYDASGNPVGVVSVRFSARVQLCGEATNQELEGSLVDAFSVSDSPSSLSDLYKEGVSEAQVYGGDDVFATERIIKKLIQQRRSWLRNGFQNTDEFPQISHEEASLGLAFPRRLFMGQIRQDDAAGLLNAKKYATVFTTNTDLPLTVE